MKLSTSDRKKFRVKNKIKKVAKSNRFRLCVSRSSKHISAQVIDDNNKKTLFAASSVQKDIKNLKVKNKTDLSKVVAERLANIAKEKKITKVYFDRGVHRYHGRVKIFAEVLRKNGMDF